MGEKVEIINEHWSRSLLERDTLDYSKFYRRQIEEFLDVSRQDNKELKQRINKAIHRIQLLQMEGEVSIKDLGLIIRDLRGDKE